MNRRQFLRETTIMAGSMGIVPSFLATNQRASLISVLGPVKPEALGITLIHEHIMADFIGAAGTGTHRYNPDQVVEIAVPYLNELKEAGCQTLIDCTPVYLGRDARVLQSCAKATGLNIFTTTGYYCAVKQKFLPKHAFTESAQQLADRWVNEFKNGIEGSGIFPGLIKTSVDEGPLLPVCEKILTAVAIAHLQTGLSISAHTGNGEAALQELAVLQNNGVHASAFRWVHAQNEKDNRFYVSAAKMGAWIEFDGINGSEPGNIDHHIACVKFMKENGFLNQTLISQDAGWYWVGEPGGGVFRRYTDLFDKFIPALKKSGFTDVEVTQLLVHNPRESLTIRVRKN